MKYLKKLIIVFFLLIFLISCEDNKIGKNYALDYNANEEINLINSQKSGNGYDIITISGHILFYGFSKDYIIVIQKPSDSIYSFKENLRFPEMMKKIYESKFNQFWILNVKNDSLFGPYQKTEYLKKREKIGVPKNLKIDYSTSSFYGNEFKKHYQYKNPDVEVIDIINLKGN